MKLALSTNIPELTYKCNRMWLWWWSTQTGEVRELAVQARGADINVLGDAGRLGHGAQGLDNAYNPVLVGDLDRYEEGESIPSRTVTEIFTSESAAAISRSRALVCQDRKLMCESLIGQSEGSITDNTG